MRTTADPPAAYRVLGRRFAGRAEALAHARDVARRCRVPVAVLEERHDARGRLVSVRLVGTAAGPEPAA